MIPCCPYNLSKGDLPKAPNRLVNKRPRGVGRSQDLQRLAGDWVWGVLGAPAGRHEVIDPHHGRTRRTRTRTRTCTHARLSLAWLVAWLVLLLRAVLWWVDVYGVAAPNVGDEVVPCAWFASH